MIRCVRIWTGDDRNSHFEEGVIDVERGDALSGRMSTTTISFEETAPGGAFAWHTAPIRQFYAERNSGLPDARRGALPHPSGRHPFRRGHGRQRT